MRAGCARQRHELKGRHGVGLLGGTAKHELGIGRGRSPVTESLRQPKRRGRSRQEIGPQCDGALIAGERFVDPTLLLEIEGEGVKRVGRVGVDLGPAAKAGLGFRRPAESLQRGSQMVPDVDERGIEPRCFAERGNCWFVFAGQEERIAKVVVGAIVVGSELDRLAIVTDPFLDHPASLQDVSEVVVARGVTGIELQRAPVRRDGVARSPHILEHVAEIGVVNRVVRVALDGAPDQADRRIEIVVSEAHEPEQMRGIRMVWIIRKQPLINRGSVIQPAGAVQLERLIQQGCVRLHEGTSYKEG